MLTPNTAFTVEQIAAVSSEFSRRGSVAAKLANAVAEYQRDTGTRVVVIELPAEQPTAPERPAGAVEPDVATAGMSLPQVVEVEPEPQPVADEVINPQPLPEAKPDPVEIKPFGPVDEHILTLPISDEWGHEEDFEMISMSIDRQPVLQIADYMGRPEGFITKRFRALANRTKSTQGFSREEVRAALKRILIAKGITVE